MRRTTWLTIAGLFILALAGRILTKPSSNPSHRYAQDFPEAGCPYATSDSYKAPKKYPCHCGLFHIWSPEHNGCVGLVNTSCARGRLCATNLLCDTNDWCKCIHQYTATKDRICIPTLLPGSSTTADTTTAVVTVPSTTKPVPVTRKSDTSVAHHGIVIHITWYNSSAPIFFKSSTLVLVLVIVFIVPFV